MDKVKSVQWTASAVAPRLRRGALHLWKIACDGEDTDLNDLWSHLSPREYDKAHRLRQILHRQRYVCAHAGLRRILSMYMGTRPQDIVFAYGSMGKPSIREDLEFNMTTSADLALVAVRLEQAVGIDCEHKVSRSNMAAIAKRMFDAETARRVELAPETRKVEVFSLAWTALEASVKADGSGLFRSHDITATANLDIAHFIPAAGYMAAVAGQHLPPPSDWTTLSLI